MYCSRCGNAIADQARFCGTCGQIVPQSVSPSGGPGLPPVEKQPQTTGSGAGKSFQGKLFWVLWLLLAIFCLLMLLGAFSPLALALDLVLLGGLFLLRKRLFTSWLKSIGVLLFAVVMAALPPVFQVDDAGLNRDVAKIEKALRSNDVDSVAEFLHPESSPELLPVLAEHEQELERIGAMLKSRKLLYADASYAEYEVTENGRTYIMIFEKVDGVWRLSRF